MDAFISYRRTGGIDIARNVWYGLQARDYNSFFDIKSIRDGEFPETILRNIINSNNIILILSKNSLDRCVNDDDWVRKEIVVALSHKKNIIPIICQDFEFPKDLPQDIEKIKTIQGIGYNGLNFEEVIAKLVIRLNDEKGKSLRLKKKRNLSNTFYEEEPMAQEEKARILADYESAKSIETKIFDRLLADKENVILFNPAIYEANAYMKKYDRAEIGQVYGLLNHQEDVAEANKKYSNHKHQENMFYVGNMEHDTFEDEMDHIISNHNISSFDFVDLTLILRDVEKPVEKLRQVVSRTTPGGIIYIRELDHGMALAYPDDEGLFSKMFEYIRKDDYSGDYEAGRKVYSWMKEADLEDIHFEAHQISTVGMKKKEKRVLFEALFSYVEREYRALEKKESTLYRREALEWLEEYYEKLQKLFCNDDFFFSTGFMEFYGFVEE